LASDRHAKAIFKAIDHLSEVERRKAEAFPPNMVHIVQRCASGCGMKVEMLLWPGDVIPEPRVCFACEGAERTESECG
jgi:hypothetical protein